MSRYQIASQAGGGNPPPACHLGARLLRRGHRVRPIGWAGMAARAAQAGLEFTAYPHVPPWPAGAALEHGRTRLAYVGLIGDPSAAALNPALAAQLAQAQQAVGARPIARCTMS